MRMIGRTGFQVTSSSISDAFLRNTLRSCSPPGRTSSSSLPTVLLSSGSLLAGTVSSMPSVVHLLLTLLLMNNLDEYPQDLLDALIREAFLERPLIPRHRFEWERLHLPSYSVFRFHREDVIRLAVALRLPAVISTGHEDFKSWEGLLISLHYFASTVYFRAFGSSIIAHTHRNGRLAVHKMGFPAEPPRPLHAACSCKSMARVCCCR
eukprot:g73107.t1